MWGKDVVSLSDEKQYFGEGKRLAALAGIIAHLKIVGYKEELIAAQHDGNFTLRRLGAFILDRRRNRNTFPVQCHKRSEIRAGVGLILLLREWSTSFLREHLL
jgi:hypothetical protein